MDPTEQTLAEHMWSGHRMYLTVLTVEKHTSGGNRTDSRVAREQ